MFMVQIPQFPKPHRSHSLKAAAAHLETLHDKASYHRNRTHDNVIADTVPPTRMDSQNDFVP